MPCLIAEGALWSFNIWKIHLFSMGKSTISMAIFNSYVCLPEGISIKNMWTHNQRCYIPMFATSIPMFGDYVSTFGGYDIPILGDHIPILLVVTSQSLAIM